MRSKPHGVPLSRCRWRGNDQVFPYGEGRKDPTALGHKADSKTSNAFGIQPCDRLTKQPYVAFARA